MIFKWIGAIIIIAVCGGLGTSLVATQINDERTLRNLVSLLDYMECELQYNLTALPALCRECAAESKGQLAKVFLELAHELEDQISPDVNCCVRAAVAKCPGLPTQTKENLLLLGRSLGKFDLKGQVLGIEGVRQNCRRTLESLSQNYEHRLRGCQTLALCAGAALVILFI